MAEESSVKLHGFWASPFVLRANLALRVKGIDFEYVEEDLSNKSESLLQNNPVHKKVPVLVHNCQAIVESMVILEYIDEAWPRAPHLLPKDPYIRARHRFWAAYLQLAENLMAEEGKALKNAVNVFLEKLDVVEEGMKEIFPSGVPSFHEVTPGYLDIVLYSMFGAYEAVEEVLRIQILIPERFPLLLSWVKALREVPEVKEVTPPAPKMIGLLKAIRQKLLASKAA